MLETVLAVLIAADLALVVGVVALYRRLWHLTASVECLCSNLGGLREQIGSAHTHGAPQEADDA